MNDNASLTVSKSTKIKKQLADMMKYNFAFIHLGNGCCCPSQDW